MKSGASVTASGVFYSGGRPTAPIDFQLGIRVRGPRRSVDNSVEMVRDAAVDLKVWMSL